MRIRIGAAEADGHADGAAAEEQEAAVRASGRAAAGVDARVPEEDAPGPGARAAPLPRAEGGRAEARAPGGQVVARLGRRARRRPAAAQRAAGRARKRGAGFRAQVMQVLQRIHSFDPIRSDQIRLDTCRYSNI